MALIPPFFPDCVVAIGKDAPNSTNKVWIASGFFYGSLVDATTTRHTYRIYLVTNSHVIDKVRENGTTKAYIRVNPLANQGARTFDVNLFLNGNPAWYSNPNPGVDVAVVPIDFNILERNGMQTNFFASDDHSMTTNDLQRSGVTEGDYAYVLGFPMSLVSVGENRNTVIVRGGPIARIKEVYENVHKDFLVDVPVFPGNSGGPVVLKPETVAITGTQAPGKASLIGIVKAYIQYTDEAMSKQTGETRVIFRENSGLSLAHTVDCINEAVQEHVRTLNI